MEQQNTIENSVASAILEKSIDNIDIEGVTYEIAPPSTATLILISEIVATLPVVKKVPAEEIVTSVFIIRKSKCSTDFKRNDFLKKNEAYPLGALRSLKFAYRKLRISLFVELAV